MSKKLLYVSIFSLSWALSIFFNKLAINIGIKPVPYTVQTTLVSVVLLTIYVFFAFKKELRKINIEALRNLFFIGSLVGTAYIAGIYGLRLSTSINYSFLIKSTLVFTILLAFIFLKEKVDRKKALLLSAFIIGAYLITTGGKTIIPKIGDLLIIFAAFCFSSALVIQKQLTRKINPDIIAWGRMSFALFVLLLVGFFVKANFFQLIALRYVVLVGLLSAVLVIYLSKAISVSSASYITMMSMSVPVINTLLGTVFLKETMNIFQIIGGILIISNGILVHKWKI